MKKKILLFMCLLAACTASAQLSSNPNKFLGNITTSYNVDFGNEKFYTLWNQITPENESKWDAVEGSARGTFNFGNADKAANYAKQHGFPFKYHTLIWGAQYPSWMNNLSTAEQYKAIVEYFDAVKKHYPNLEIIDVVNEAVDGHQPAPYKAALGGNGRTGYDWIAKAFQLAHERWPNAILVYNDYNTFQWQRTQFINLVRTLRDAGAPIDAYGCQSHDITDISLNDFKNAMAEIQNAVKPTLKDSKNWQEFIRKLRLGGVEVEFKKRRGNDDVIDGITFIKDGVRFKGSQIGCQFSYAKLNERLTNDEPILTVNHEQTSRDEQPRQETNVAQQQEQHHNREPSFDFSLGLFDTTNPAVDPAEEEFRRRMQRKKKKRGPRL